MSTTFLCFFWQSEKKKALHTLTFFSAYLSLSLAPLSCFPLTHSPLCFSYSAVLFAVLCLPSPHPSLPPTRLLIHPLGEQYRELTTVISIAISYNSWKKKCVYVSMCINTFRSFRKGSSNMYGSHYECIVHMLENLYNSSLIYVRWCDRVHLTHIPIHIHSIQYRIDAAGLSMYTSAYGNNTGGICHTYTYLNPGYSPWLQAFWLMLIGWNYCGDP